MCRSGLLLYAEETAEWPHSHTYCLLLTCGVTAVLKRQQRAAQAYRGRGQCNEEWGIRSQGHIDILTNWPEISVAGTAADRELTNHEQPVSDSPCLHWTHTTYAGALTARSTYTAQWKSFCVVLHVLPKQVVQRGWEAASALCVWSLHNHSLAEPYFYLKFT